MKIRLNEYDLHKAAVMWAVSEDIDISRIEDVLIEHGEVTIIFHDNVERFIP